MVWNLYFRLGRKVPSLFPLVEVVFISHLKDQVVRNSPSDPFRVVDIVFKGINLFVELGDAGLLQGVALDSPDTISTSICHKLGLLLLRTSSITR